MLISDDPNDPWYGKELQGPGPRRYAGDTVPAECLEERVLLSTITVTSLADTLNAGNGVTLRDAIQAANTDTSGDHAYGGAIYSRNGAVTLTNSTILVGLDGPLPGVESNELVWASFDFNAVNVLFET